MGSIEELVYAVETDASQDTLSPEEFCSRAKYGRKNDPERVRLTAN